MKILCVTNMYPCPQRPYLGIFVKEQVDSLSKKSDIIQKVFFIKGFKSKFTYLASVFTVNFHLLFNRYDIIHIHFGLSGLFLLINPFIKAKKVIMVHGNDILDKERTPLTVYLTSLVLKKVDLIYTVSDHMASFIHEHKNKIIIQPCGINDELFKPSGDAKRDVNQSDFKIIFPSYRVGRPEKQYHLFCQIMKIIRENYKLNVEEIALEYMTRQQVAETINSADCLLLTSLYEGSPQVVKESLACNTPVVSSNVGDVADVLKNVPNCFVTSSYNPEEFAEYVVKVLKSPLRKTNGREKIFERRLDLGSVADNIYNNYKTLLNK